MQVRICKKCGTKNPISSFVCEKCNADISMEPFSEQREAEVKMYKICPTCNAHVTVKSKTEILKFCPQCHSDAIHRVGEEQVEVEQEGEVEKDSESGTDSGENAGSRTESDRKINKEKKGVILRNRQDGMRVFVGSGTHLLGAYGDCEPDYFWNLQYVSSEHLVIKVAEGRVFVMDHNSRNSSWINGERLLPDVETELMEGDLLKLADQYFEVEFCR